MKNSNLPTILSEGAITISPVSTEPTDDEASPSINSDSNNNQNNNEDEQAALEAARHRHQAQNLVREHLENHSTHNPGASSDYVTWIATLHPENADITIDQRFFVPGNPWWSIYEDTKNNQIPVATAVPLSNVSDTVREEEDLEQGSVGEKPDPEQPLQQQPTTTSKQQQQQQQPQNDIPHWCCTCNPIALLVALAITLPAMCAVLCCELVALLCFHVPATLFYHSGQAFAPPNICTCLLYFLFMILYGAMSLADSCVLLASVMVTESVGLVALLVGFLTGGCLWARNLQQSIRRSCHGIRVSFRRSEESTTMPSRGLCCCRRTSASLERERKANRGKGVKVVQIQRVRRAGESCH